MFEALIQWGRGLIQCCVMTSAPVTPVSVEAFTFYKYNEYKSETMKNVNIRNRKQLTSVSVKALDLISNTGEFEKEARSRATRLWVYLSSCFIELVDLRLYYLLSTVIQTK